MYRYQDVYTLDFTAVTKYWDMHAVIREVFDWPEYYGCNWDAFWDCLTNMVGRPIRIEIVGLDTIERKFGDSAGKMLNILREFQHYENDAYCDEIRIEIVKGDSRVRLE